MGDKEKQDSDWLVDVEKSLEEEIRPEKSHCGLIHTVPKSLLSKHNKVFYYPQFICFGPYHFREKLDVQDEDMELLKSDVARKMDLRIRRNGALTMTDGLKSIVEHFKSEKIQKMIEESYATEIKLSRQDVCAWMIVRDSCFVLEVLHRFGEDDQDGGSAFIDSILSRKRHHPLLKEIVKDMLKMENQLPFWALEKIRGFIFGPIEGIWFESALKKLSPIKVPHEGKSKYKRESHILQLLHDYIVDRQIPNSSSLNSACCGIKKLNFHTTMAKSSPKKWLLAVTFLPVFVVLFLLGIIFVILHYIKNHIFDILYSIMNCLSPGEEETEEHVPSIEELRRGGMKFKKLKGGISQIKFEKKTSTLYLPQFKVDDRSEVILRNLIALEIRSREEQKPITRYAILMNDLVDTSGDVGLLRREDIITGTLGNDAEIAKLWNSMVTPTEMPRYESIDKAATSINRYHKKWQKRLSFLRHRRLWGDFIGLLLEFITTYGSRPWWLFSALIVLAVLVLTAVQVICLFKSCQVI